MKRPSSSTKTMPYPHPSWGRPGGPWGGLLAYPKASKGGAGWRAVPQGSGVWGRTRTGGTGGEWGIPKAFIRAFLNAPCSAVCADSKRQRAPQEHMQECLQRLFHLRCGLLGRCFPKKLKQNSTQYVTELTPHTCILSACTVSPHAIQCQRVIFYRPSFLAVPVLKCSS